jgi:tetratricopeptide (TPR) repeat protein
MNLIKSALAMILAAGISVSAAAETADEAVAQLQKAWAIDNYQLSGTDKQEALVALIDEADERVAAHPNEASVYIWRGIITSTYAGAKGGLGALKYAKAAKRDLEKAISLDGRALQGSAYTSLGTLYFNVPGWPIGFGDDDKAEELLKKALDINPKGIDANYFYGDFLRKEKRYQESSQYLHTALNAAPRPGREVADAGRQQEIKAMLAEVDAQLTQISARR